MVIIAAQHQPWVRLVFHDALHTHEYVQIIVMQSAPLGYVALLLIGIVSINPYAANAMF